MASNIVIITVGENTVEIKSLICPLEMENLDEVVAMITYLEDTQTRPLIVQGMTSVTTKILVEVTTSESIVLMARP